MDMDTFSAGVGWNNAKLGMSTDSLTGDVNFSAIATLATDFYVWLDALVETRQARVHASPRIATLSGSSASIFIGTQQFLEIPVSIPGRGTSNSIDAGVKLDMSPLTGGEGEIILTISEEISTLSAPSAVTGLPEKTTRSAQTTVRVRDGETLIIGGLRQEESREVRSRIPLLGDIPIIGQLFRSKRIEKTEVDLTIFVTARILSQTGHLPDEEEAAIKARFLVNEPGEEGADAANNE